MPQNLITLQQAVNIIKTVIEGAITSGGTEAKNNLIRSQQPIKLLHEVVKSELIRLGVNQAYINPPLEESAGELKLAGFFKHKNQDICVTPNNIEKRPEILEFEGILYGQNDVFGKEFTEKTLSVNVRSQLSSSAKNFDTLYERTFAEALNLHLRCPEMVLGEFYMIAVNEYDSDTANINQVAYRNIAGIDKHIQKYLLSFSAINGRNNVVNHHYKYERVCLLIVDFSHPIPKIYNTDAELRADGLLPEGSIASINNLSFANFIAELLQTYNERFGEGKFI
ncbi:MAG: hypothetical protein RR279_05805 [Alistipes sp.]